VLEVNTNSKMCATHFYVEKRAATTPTKWDQRLVVDNTISGGRSVGDS
jgi:hypothetical protein